MMVLLKEQQEETAASIEISLAIDLMSILYQQTAGFAHLSTIFSLFGNKKTRKVRVFTSPGFLNLCLAARTIVDDSNDFA